MQFTINLIDQTTGVPNITYTTDGGNNNTENFANAVGLNLDDLTAYLINYCQAYDNGIVPPPFIDPSVTDAIGEQTVSA